jgi:hypothetical protein
MENGRMDQGNAGIPGGQDRCGGYLREEREGLVWRMRSKTTRFTGRFSEDGSVITGHWELLGESGDRQPWMDISLTRQGT